jgi:hypothetical protein
VIETKYVTTGLLTTMWRQWLDGRHFGDDEEIDIKISNEIDFIQNHIRSKTIIMFFPNFGECIKCIKVAMIQQSNISISLFVRYSQPTKISFRMLDWHRYRWLLFLQF